MYVCMCNIYIYIYIERERGRYVYMHSYIYVCICAYIYICGLPIAERGEAAGVQEGHQAHDLVPEVHDLLSNIMCRL